MYILSGPPAGGAQTVTSVVLSTGIEVHRLGLFFSNKQNAAAQHTAAGRSLM